ncbi:hypothetical protein HNO88_003980 [Novosphingobium chloroacetimidivorans]|uniref:Uncharacterized protein n=1 Tax=Novosphingobium chloroacetimidivorans TaxID=1428314 RepID=A0A7W7KD82_9SPHN|nr:P27 family phage terminase small subunit [Novosphingobium chloroacetimidivorans]MBB4860636.1 hypothetical protein [Novosphingobium chloroacetimidivorans]
MLAYIVFDRCSRAVIENGAVLKPKRGNPTAIARLSPYLTAMREADSNAGRQEQELGLSPRRRAGAAKVVRKGHPGRLAAVTSGAVPNRFLADQDPTTSRAKAAVDGKLFPCGELVRYAAERHLRHIRNGEKRGIYWRPEAAAR